MASTYRSLLLFGILLWVYTESNAQQVSSTSASVSSRGQPSNNEKSVAPANSDTSKVDDSPDAVEARDRRLDEVVVTAQRREERLKDVPISISVLTGADLDRSTAQAAADILARVPGVTVDQPVAGGTRVAIRGVTGAGEGGGVGSSVIAYYVDSVPFGFARSGFGPDVSPYDLERIEVLRGPQGTLYGANAEAGLIRVLTHEPSLDQIEVKARVRGSAIESGGEGYRADAAVNVPIVEGKVAMRAVVGYEDVPGWIDAPAGRDFNSGERRNYRLKIASQPVDKLYLSVSAWLERDDYGAPSISDDAERSSSVIPEPVSDDYDMYNLKASYDFSSFSVTSSTSDLHYQNKTDVDLGIFGQIYRDIFGGYRTILNRTSNVFSQELTASSAAGSKWIWTAGGFYRDARDEGFSAIPQLLPTPLDHGANTSESYAVFGEIGRRFLADKWQWTLGLRRFHDEVLSENLSGMAPYRASSSSDSTTPRAVLTWYPNNDITAYVSYSEGFRGGAPQSGVAYSLGIAPLKPDELHSYEMGLKADFFDRRLSLESAVFYAKWKGVQQNVTILIDNNGLPLNAPVLLNGDSASGPGVDFSMSVRPVAGLELAMNLGWNDLTMDGDQRTFVAGGAPEGVAIYAKGDRLDYSSEWTAGASAAFEHVLGGSGYAWRAIASGNYSSEQVVHAVVLATPVRKVGDPRLVARGELALISPQKWTAALFIDNATNEYGAVPTGGEFEEFRARIRPRTYGVQFDYHY